MNRDLTSALPAPLGAGLMAVFMTVAAYIMASTVSQTLTPYTMQLAKSLIVAPLIEELFFRRCVQSRLRARGGLLGRPSIAIGVTAAFFAVAHLATAPMAHAALVFVPACAIGWAYERTRSVGVCIALHSVGNAVWIWYWSV